MKNLKKLLASIRKQYEKNPNKAALNYARRTREAHHKHQLSEGARRAGKAPKPNKAWATALAAELVEQYPKATFHLLWRKIPKSQKDPYACAGFDVYRNDEDKLTAVNRDGRGLFMARETFRTDYVSVARNALKKKTSKKSVG